jgi:hypothetical protein
VGSNPTPAVEAEMNHSGKHHTALVAAGPPDS